MCRTDLCGDYINILRDEFRTAKKHHRCGECHRYILPGEKYHYQAGVDGDGFQDFKTCQHCAIPRDLIQEKCHGYIFGEIGEDLREHFDVKEWGYKAARLYIGMKRQWKRFKSDELMPVMAY